eukprot:TRINITY_DN23485_c0_g1_i1.p1 TRINITY_DN23485_c0_g1~~TRINITY_DN23485_c0_g1_i1.p1  ORF type:complete len:135 (-),score=38.80 TRINITY_DN23485_c0_g1_i1:244-648(-)
MGKIRNKTIKRSARSIIEKYYQKLTKDFHVNKKIVAEIARIPSKRMRNQIAGFATHLMKRIENGPVRGISLKLQEEEREKKMDFIPETSFVEELIADIKCDDNVTEMLRGMDVATSHVDRSRQRQAGGRPRGGR